jgi:hypothetical protein
MKVVNEKVKLDGYDLVFDTSGFSVNNVPVVLYAKDSYDFTKAIVEKLNADRPTGAVDDKSAPPALGLGEPVAPKLDAPVVPKKNK